VIRVRIFDIVKPGLPVCCRNKVNVFFSSFKGFLLLSQNSQLVNPTHQCGQAIHARNNNLDVWELFGSNSNNKETGFRKHNESEPTNNKPQYDTYIFIYAGSGRTYYMGDTAGHLGAGGQAREVPELGFRQHLVRRDGPGPDGRLREAAKEE
jgi:hypothetical protein